MISRLSAFQQKKEAVTRDSVGRAIGEKSTFDAGVGPIEPINAEGFFTDYQSERHSDKEATFESTDLDEIPGNSEFRLAPDEVPADSGGEAGGHAAHLLVAFGKVAINGRMTARDLDCSFETCCHVPFPKFLKAGRSQSAPRRTDPATRMSSCTLRPMLQVYSSTLVVPENSIRRDSRGEAESAHHRMRCLRSSNCLQPS